MEAARGKMPAAFVLGFAAIIARSEQNSSHWLIKVE